VTICKVNKCEGKVVSSGLCDKHRQRLRKHGHLKQTRPDDWGKRSKHPLWNTYKWMRKMRTKYSIDEKWDDFWKFVEDVGERPSERHQLHRINIKKGYGPNNFKWKETISCKDKNEYAREWRKRNPDKAKSSELKRKFGISIEDYETMFRNQNCGCAICGEPISIDGTSLAVDHCNETKKIRGLLCSLCNRGLGLFKHSSILLTKASNYLNNPNLKNNPPVAIGCGT